MRIRLLAMAFRLPVRPHLSTHGNAVTAVTALPDVHDEVEMRNRLYLNGSGTKTTLSPCTPCGIRLSPDKRMIGSWCVEYPNAIAVTMASILDIRLVT
jgi:hypothetical protein